MQQPMGYGWCDEGGNEDTTWYSRDGVAMAELQLKGMVQSPEADPQRFWALLRLPALDL